MTTYLIRIFDFIFSLIGLLMATPLFVVVLFIGFIDTGSPIFCQKRVGHDRKAFTLFKFRTMKRDTKDIASHLANKSCITTFGHLLRKSKLDELPQLWNVLCGEMSLVGPRPCLYSQKELIDEREKRGVFNVKPGITGLAQINKIDMSTPRLLAETDAKMIADLNFRTYFFYLVQTLSGKGAGDRIK